LGQPSLVPPLLSVDRHSSLHLFRSTATPTTPTPTLRNAGGRGGVPRGETVKRPGVLSLSGTAIRRPSLDHLKNMGDTGAAIFQTCSGSGEVCGMASPELIEQLKGSPVQIYDPFLANQWLRRM